MDSVQRISEDLNNRVHALDKAVFGDRDNPKENPGLILEHASMRLEQARTNEILTEFRGDVKKALYWLFSLIGTGIGTAILALILKHP